MEYLSDIIATIAALGAGAYCMVLSNKVKQFQSLESGMGTAVAILSAQVDDLTQALAKANASAAQSAEQLTGLTRNADAGAKKLELMLAAMHELPAPHDTRPRRRIIRRRARVPFAEEAA